jgi:hypothetical protein
MPIRFIDKKCKKSYANTVYETIDLEYDDRLITYENALCIGY